MKKNVYLNLMLLPAFLAATMRADTVKVDLNPSDTRKDLLAPHWANWAWHEGSSGSQQFGDVTVTFRVATNETLSKILLKGLLDFGATMAADGIVVKNPVNGGVEMVISGLTPGKHSVVTYHNEVRDLVPVPNDVSVGGVTQIKHLLPTIRATNDYEVASAFVEVEAQTGKDVVIRFQPEKSGTNRSLIINGFEIDGVDPRLKAIKPSPAKR